MNHDFDHELLEALCGVPAVAGHEDPMIRFVRDRFAALDLPTHVDGIGNVIARLSEQAEGPRVMLFAHVDQVGLCVKRVDDHGFVAIDRIGGINRKVLVGREVRIHTEAGDAVPGTVGVMAHHLTPEAERFTVPDIPDLYVDLGAESKDEVASLGIQVGDSITYEAGYRRLGRWRVRGPAMDDRIGVYIVLKVAERLAGRSLPNDLHVVATVQEEFNVRGALPAARAIRPDAAICVDIALPGDTPDLTGVNDVRLGGGPTMRLMSFHGRGTLGGLIPNPGLRDLMQSTATDLGMPIQREASIGGLTDASFLQLLHEGVPSIDVGVPCRYTHTPVETLDTRDVEQAIELFAGAIERIDDRARFARGA
jgi:putative aminopeptidase FrvX